MESSSRFSATLENRSMPAATVVPVLLYADVPAAAAWLCEAFGFRERLRIGSHRVQLDVGTGAVVVAQAAGEDPPSGQSTMIRIRDVDAHFAHASAFGAQTSGAPQSFPYGERQYSVRDPGGHLWTFSQSIADVEPSTWGGEMARVEDDAATQVRLLGPGDKTLLDHVAPDVFDNEIDPACALEFLGDARHHLAVALDAGQVVGFASGVHYVHPDKQPELWINEVGVAPSHHRKGLGKAVLQALLRHGRQLGCVEAWVLTERSNEAAMALYKSAGGEEAPDGTVMFNFDLTSVDGAGARQGRSDDILRLPPDLPVPVDDGAANHLAGAAVAPIRLPSTSGGLVSLADLPGRTVVYCYPRTGRPDQPPPDGWNLIPGARGCTPQSCAFRDHYAELQALGVQVFGLSTQDTPYQREAVQRLHLPFPLLSDAKLEFASAMQLPTFEVESMRLLKRLTLIIRDGLVEHVMYPVFPPDENAQQVIEWLRAH